MTKLRLDSFDMDLSVSELADYLQEFSGNVNNPDSECLALAASLLRKQDASEEALKSLKEKLAEKEKEASDLAFTLAQIKASVTPEVLGLLRCGIMANYSGVNSSDLVAKHVQPIKDILNAHPDQIAAHYAASLFENAKIPRHAKAGCAGEFEFKIEDAGTCPECWAGRESDGPCEICDGRSNESGLYDITVSVPWSLTKEIWLSMNKVYAEQFRIDAMSKGTREP